MSNGYLWASQFGEMFVDCCEDYDSGNHDIQEMFDEEDVAFLASFGYTDREMFDFIEDCCKYDDGEPCPETALLVAAVRRDYFLTVQGGKWSTEPKVNPADLPAKTDEVEGIVWLPRLLAKAEAKLRGLMHEDTMFGCSGDRRFCAKYQIHPADFLRVVWAANGNHEKVVAFIKEKAKQTEC